MNESMNASPGWYTEPVTGLLRYWDGSQWGQYAPQALKNNYEGWDIAFTIIGWIGAFLIPIVGIGCGIALCTRDHAVNGGIMIGVSVLMTLIWAASMGA